MQPAHTNEKSSRPLSLHKIPRKGRKRFYLWLTATVGISLSFLAYWYTGLLVQREQNAIVETMAFERQALLLSSVNATTEVLDGVGALIDSSQHVAREEFKVFTYPVLQRHPEFWAIHWMPKVLHSERPQFEDLLKSEGFSGRITELSAAKNVALPSRVHPYYYPILYTEPMMSNQAIVGFDANSRMLNQKAMQATLTEGLPFASTAPFKLVQDNEGSASVVFFRPVFGPEHISADAQQRALRIRGFIAALVKPQILLDQFTSADDIATQLVDITDDSQRLVAQNNWSSVQPNWLRHAIDFNTVGRQWRFEFAISPIFLIKESGLQANRAAVVFVVGILVTLLIFMIMRDLVKAHRKVERERDRAQTYLDTVETIIMAVDREGNLTLINRKGCEILGYAEQELLKTHWFSERYLEQPQVLFNQYERLMQGHMELVRYSESVIITCTGQKRLIAWHNSLQYNAEGRVIGMLSAGDDITRQNELQSLERSRSQAMQAALNGNSLESVLNIIIQGIETQDPSAMCSILLLDESGQHLSFAAAPSLPQAYCEAIDGVRIGTEVGSCGAAAYHKKRVVTENIQQDPDWKNYQDLAETYGLSSCWSEPIMGKNGRILGTFAIYHKRPTRPDQHDLELIESHANFVSILIEQFQAEVRLLHIANTDELTGLPNRRQFMERLGVEFRRSSRYGSPLSLLMLDIDHFKKVNDRYGHAIGDEVLRQLAVTCQMLLRETDMAGRLGGEEFAVVLSDTDQTQAQLVAERMLKALSDLELELTGGQTLRFTVSIGAATLTEQDVNPDMFLSRADHSLYYAKQHGRNQVSFIEADLSG